VLRGWGVHRGVFTGSKVDRAWVVQGRARVVEGGARVVYWGSRFVYWLGSRFVRSRSRRMVRSRVMIRVDSCSFIGNLCHIPSMMVCVVVHYLGTAIRQGNGVGTFNHSSLVLCLSFSKLSTRV